MTPRPLISSSRRPLSAIFLGSLPPKEQIISNLPEHPESPSAVSSSSGLPSPPATNSTGSGSTGDNKSATAGSLRQRPASYAGSVNMSDRNYDTPSTPAKSSRNIDDDDDDENDYSNEEDDTARLDRSHAIKSPNENLVALQRVKSLAERNRMALNKLSSFSRLSTPSPANSRASRSPLPPIHASSSSSSSSAASRISSHSHSHSAPMTRQYDRALQYDSALSGSETERESQRAPTPSYSNSHSNSRSYGSSSPERSSTPPPSTSTRERRTSAPASPVRSRQSSPALSHTPRKRVSIASALSVPRDDASYDVTSAALAAVASSRRSPTGTGSVNRRSRQPLPREFRDGDRARTLDDRTSIEPMTPYHNSRQDSYTSNANTSHRTSSYANPNPRSSPRGAHANRSSTVRELTRRHQTRWLSDDIPSLPDSGRKQTQRGGSAESTLGAGGRLLGEGLRAAGIGMRNGTQANDDVFVHSNDSHVSLRRARTAGSSIRRTVEWEDENKAGDDRSRTSGSSGARLSEGAGPSTRPHLSSDPSRSSSALLIERDSRGGRAASSRPATSMAEFYHGEDGSAGRGAAFSLRSRRQYSGIERQPSGASPGIRPLPPQQAPTLPDRSHSGTLTRRHTTMTPLGNGSVSSLHSHQQSAEHTKLMIESLAMFENILSRLPNQSASVPDLFRSAETIVLASEKLNVLLRTGTNRALEQQIDAEMDEISGEIPTGEIWRRVGGEYRESLRVSDEVVRMITGFLLGVGKIVKEASAGALNDPGLQHSRSDLGDDVSRRTPEIDRSSNRSRQDGRRSVESRRSWEPSGPTTDLSRRLTGRAEGVVARPPSSRDRDPDQDQSSSPRNSLTLPPLPLSATRRLFTPREQRDFQMTSNALASHNNPSDVVDLSLEYEPSPTPAARGVPAGRQKPLPSLAIPPPLPTLPSESLMGRSTSNLLDKSSRRKPSTTSTATIRGLPLPCANPTTAVTTHTVSNSPENSAFPLSRVDSQDSVRSSVTFSRPSEVSLSALQQQHIRDEARRKVITSSSNTEEDSDVAPAPSPAQVRSPLSGSETERDTRRRTLGIRAARMSLDSIRDEREGDNGGSQSRTVALPSQRRERRRTVTEVFA